MSSVASNSDERIVPNAIEPSANRSDSFYPGLVFAPPVANAEMTVDVLLHGDLVGDFIIDRRIGAGGMGVVYEAIDQRLGRRVAIKILRAAAITQTEQPLLQEARATACLEHENFVRVYGLSTLPSGQPYMVMELLRGQSLFKWLSAHHNLSARIRIFTQIAQGMAFAHRRGIVHRDLKPENIFVTVDERVKILDLGLAGLVAIPQQSTLQRAGLPQLEAEQSGTPSYLSPECWRGAPPTTRLDVWAVGIMLYEACSGGLHPFWMQGLDLNSNVQRVLFQQYPRLMPQPGESPVLVGQLDAIAERALRRAPSERFVDAGELLSALMDLQSTDSPQRPRAPVFSKSLLQHIGQQFSTGTLLTLVLLWGQDSGRQYLTPTPEMSLLPAGTFHRGSSPSEIQAAHRFCLDEVNDVRLCLREQLEREQPVQRVSVSAFWMDRTEVTNQQFADWLNQMLLHKQVRVAHDRQVFPIAEPTILLADVFPFYNPSNLLLFSDGKFVVPPESGQIPVSQVTWEGAQRYCAAHGKRLPTEAEWEYAARGGGQVGFRFPWGSKDPTCNGVVAARDIVEIKGKDLNTTQQIPLPCSRSQATGPAPVGSSSQDVSPQGIHDLAGNVAEWVEDSFVERYPDCGACQNPHSEPSAKQTEATQRVFRGGSWTFLLAHSRSAARSRFDSLAPSRDVGFRCVKDVDG